MIALALADVVRGLEKMLRRLLGEGGDRLHVAGERARGLDADDDLGELARATGLLLVRVRHVVDGALDGLAVRDLRLADVRVDVELAHHPVADDFEMQQAEEPAPAAEAAPTAEDDAIVEAIQKRIGASEKQGYSTAIRFISLSPPRVSVLSGRRRSRMRRISSTS